MSSRPNSALWWAYKAERARAKADKAVAYAEQCERRYHELLLLTTSDRSGTITTTNAAERA